MAFVTQNTQNEASTKSYHKLIKKKIRILNFILLMAIAFVLVSLIYIIDYSIQNPDWDGCGDKIFTGVMYMVLGVCFAVTSFNIVHELKTNFNEFYVENKVNLIVASVGLTVPLLARGIIDTYSAYWSKSVANWAETHEDYYNSFILIFCDVTPIFF